MTLTVILALYGIALVSQRRSAEPEGVSSSTVPTHSERKLSLLRVLFPRYHFFEAIEERLWLGARPLGSARPYEEVSLPPRRTFWFLLDNARENLWLYGESTLPGILEMLRSTSEEANAKARDELERRLEEHGFEASPLEYALLLGITSPVTLHRATWTRSETPRDEEGIS